MFTSILIYSVMAVVVMLVVSALDNGIRWDTKQCVFLGIFWVVSVPMMLALYLYKRYIQK